MQSSGERTGRIIAALADLADDANPHAGSSHTIPLDWFHWVAATAVGLFTTPWLPPPDANAGAITKLAHGFATSQQAPPVPALAIDRRIGEALGSIDAIRPEQRALRAGWLFVAGKEQHRGTTRAVFHPLVTVPIRIRHSPAGSTASTAGDVELTPLVADRDTRRRLERSFEFGRGALDGTTNTAIPQALIDRLDNLRRFAFDAAAAAGFGVKRLVPADRAAEELQRRSGLVVVAGVGFYAIHEAVGLSAASALRAWEGGTLDEPSALSALYGDDVVPVERRADDPPESPFLLTPAQRSALLHARTERVTVVSGAPGTGKSHTIAAIACDAVMRGESVLVAAKTDATVDALVDLLDRAPGPDPVVFGSNERRDALAARLAGGQYDAADAGLVEDARRRATETVGRRDNLTRQVIALLHAEQHAEDGELIAVDARSLAPRLFESGCDLDHIAALLDDLVSPTEHWLQRHHHRALRREVDDLCGSAADASVESLRAALNDARAAHDAAALVAAGGLELAGTWRDLERLDAETRQRVGEWAALEARSSDRFTRKALAAVGALSTALRSGRAIRRQMLARLRDDRLTDALALWIGTLSDIDDLLPPVHGLFDLVILDEASSIEQPLAAPALLRADRAVIVGDPRQLRHVSFLSDEAILGAMTLQGLDDDPVLAALLDVRRNSIFDVGVAAAPVIQLTEHFRSNPHLIDFVARRLYAGVVQAATRSPHTDCLDCVDVVRIEGSRNREGVVTQEVTAVVGRLRALRDVRARSIGVVTPFRAQADALEKAIVAAFSADELRALDLRVGTVHAFQGNERDTIIASLGIGDGAEPGTWRFVDDPHLLAVFLTRARRRMVFVHSADPPPGSLLAEYLAQADTPSGPPPPAGPVDEWTGWLASALEGAGVDARTAYPVGRHIVELAINGDLSPFFVETGVCADGAQAHVERHLALRHAGWESLDAYPTRWGERRGELVVQLVQRIRPNTVPPPPVL